MDGGIVDNQGIEPILLAEQRMKSNFPGRKDKCLELIIISDVSSPYMKPYESTDLTLPKSIANLSLNKLSTLLWIVGGIITVLTAVSLILMPNSFLSGFLSVFWLLSLLGIGGYMYGKKKLMQLAKGTIVNNSVSSILNLKVGDIATLLVNRVKSVMMLVSSVFMKHLRRMNYRSAYTDEAWMNRCITNGIYELRKGESWEANIKSGYLPSYLAPSDLIQQNSKKAASMGTTLWFTECQKADGMHDSIIAAGQYTMCFNLLKYIECTKKDPRNTNERHKEIIACENQLKADWDKFQNDPLWGVKQFK